ncbi:MAG: glycosyltransferase family 4 protein [Anaerolineaceae bacterium]|nr:glycosyltransferase family 4 protein [Anaerolineaceae bacterium]
MRILLAVHGFPPTHIGGAERAAERIARGLVQNGHHVEVFALENVNAPETEFKTTSQDGITVHQFSLDVRGDVPRFVQTYDNQYIGKIFRQVLQSGKFDIVHLISGYMLGVEIIRAAQEMGIPTVLTLTEYWFMCIRLNLLDSNDSLCTGPESDDKCTRCVMNDKRRYRYLDQYVPSIMDTFWSLAQYTPIGEVKIREVATRRQILERTLASVDLVICPSQFIIDKFAEYGYNTSKFVLIPHGIGESGVMDIQRDRSPILRLGYMGQIKPHKGIDLIVQAVVNVLQSKQAVSLDIWGDTNTGLNFATKLIRQTRRCPTIRWNGRFKGSEQLKQVLSQFDVLVVPSRWYENSPTVILEAFKAGIPVITTRLGGMAELVTHDQNGLLFEINDVDELTAHLRRLINEPDLLPRLRAGIPRVRSAEDEVHDIFEHYVRLTTKMKAQDQ